MGAKFYNLFGFIFLISINFSCVEEIDLQSKTSESFKSVLVVEATITNEVTTQRILLTRTTPLEVEFNPVSESGATVTVKDNSNNSYTFQENNPGEYLSNQPFGALANLEYHLEISTDNDRKYSSTNMQLTQSSLIDNLYVERGFNENNEEGVSIFVDAFDPTGNSKFYRFEYEETYKIIAPYYSPLELVPKDVEFGFPFMTFSNLTKEEIIDFFVELKLRDEQEQICYNTVKSNTIILANTTNLQENRLERFRTRFIKRDNFILSHRYSILVKQFVQSSEAHSYYEVLKSFSDSESLFSENQVGFIDGNMFSITSKQEKVIGFFDVSSVDVKRIYFNYSDLFPGEQLPPYYITCDDFLSPLLFEENLEHLVIRSPLQEALNSGQQFFEVNENANPNIFLVRPFILVLEPCGDCTVLGKNMVPDFWEE